MAYSAPWQGDVPIVRDLSQISRLFIVAMCASVAPSTSMRGHVASSVRHRIQAPTKATLRSVSLHAPTTPNVSGLPRFRYGGGGGGDGWQRRS